MWTKATDAQMCGSQSVAGSTSSVSAAGGAIRGGLLRGDHPGGLDRMARRAYDSRMIIILVCLSILSALQAACIIAAYWLLPRYIARLRREITAQIVDAARALVESPADDQPSPLAVLADQCATLLVGRAQQAIESRLRGASGAAQREDNKDQLQSALASGPAWLPMVASMLPRKWLKLLASNPQFLGQLPLAGFGGKPNGNGNDSVANRIRNQS